MTLACCACEPFDVPLMSVSEAFSSVASCSLSFFRRCLLMFSSYRFTLSAQDVRFRSVDILLRYNVEHVTVRRGGVMAF